jgi:hypothetical protein
MRIEEGGEGIAVALSRKTLHKHSLNQGAPEAASSGVFSGFGK